MLGGVMPGITPPGQQFRYVRVQHTDGTTYDYPSLWFTAEQLADMTDEQIAAEKYSRDVNLWLWAAGLHDGVVDGSPVMAVVAEWVGPLGTGPTGAVA